MKRAIAARSPWRSPPARRSPAAQAQDGITPTSILIGQSAAFTGPAAQLGIQMRDGAKLWLDYVNAQGGINGRKIELKSRDDKYESKLAAENTKKLIERGPRLRCSSPTSARRRRRRRCRSSPRRRVPFVAPFTGAELLRTPFNRYIFNVRASYFDETETHRRPPDAHRRQEDRRVLPERRLRPGGLEGVKRALAQAQPADRRARAPSSATRPTVADAVKTINAAQPEATVMISAYTLGRRVRAADEEGRQHLAVLQRLASSAARRSPRRSATRATA